MQKIERAHRKCLGTRRHDKNEGLRVPKTKEVRQVPRGGELWRDLRPMDVAQQLPSRRAFQPRRIAQVAVHRPQRVRRRVPSDRQVAQRPGQKNNPHALVKQRQNPAVKYENQNEAKQHTRNQKWQPHDDAQRPAPGCQCDADHQRRRHH